MPLAKKVTAKKLKRTSFYRIVQNTELPPPIVQTGRRKNYPVTLLRDGFGFAVKVGARRSPEKLRIKLDELCKEAEFNSDERASFVTFISKERDRVSVHRIR